jgi:hypothetical protein
VGWLYYLQSWSILNCWFIELCTKTWKIWYLLRVAFYNNLTGLIVIVTKLDENFTKNNLKYIMKYVILSLKNKKLFGLWARFLCKRLQLISVRTRQMKKIHNYRYSLKYKKLNMQIGQLYSVLIFFCQKIDYFWLGMQNLRWIQKKKKSVEFKIFDIIFFRRNSK